MYRILLHWWKSFRGTAREEAEEILSEELAAHRERLPEGAKIRERYWAEAAGDARVSLRAEAWGADLKQAWRALKRDWRPASAVTITLAVALGAGIAVLSVVDRTLWKPLPFPEEDRLAWLGFKSPLGSDPVLFGPDYYDWRDSQQAFTAMAASGGTEICNLEDESPRRLICATVTANFLEVLGVPMLRGRMFNVAEDLPQSTPTVVLSHGMWLRSFGGDANALGRKIALSGKLREVIGVLPANFELPSLAEFDFMIPLAMDEAQQRRGPENRMLFAMARLKPNISWPTLNSVLAPQIATSMNRVPPAFRKEVSFEATPLRERQVTKLKTTSLLLLGGVAAILLLACANAANLLLARTATRERETSIRRALGATRLRLMRTDALEALLLGGAAGIFGSAIAWALLRVAIQLAPSSIPRLSQASIDARALGWAIALTFAVTFLSHLSRPVKRAAGVLVSSQAAFSVLLLGVAALLLGSLVRLESTPLGLNPENLTEVRIQFDGVRHPNGATRGAFASELEQRLKALPGVEAVAVTNNMPPVGNANARIRSRMEAAGLPPAHFEGTGGMVIWRLVNESYFRALEIPLVAGRPFNPQDRVGAKPEVAILSRSLARSFFADRNPIGQRVRGDAGEAWLEVVGVAEDAKNAGLSGKDNLEFYLPLTPDYPPRMQAALRSRVPLDAMRPMIEAEVRRIDPKQAIEFGTMEGRIGKSIAGPRFQTFVLGAFALAGLLIACSGIFAALAYQVEIRRREYGVRAAVGATPATLFLHSLGMSSRWVGAGLVAGMTTLAAANRWLSITFFGLENLEWPLLAAAAVLLFIASTLAAWLPSRAAARLDPAQILRQ